MQTAYGEWQELLGLTGSPGLAVKALSYTWANTSAYLEKITTTSFQIF